MEDTAAAVAAARLLSSEDVVLEILQRVSTDVAALFRCAVACKRWHGLVADRSFLRGCWPENAPSLLGFFVRQRVDMDVKSPYRLFFVPPPAGSVLGSQRRLLTSMAGVDGVPDDDSHYAVPLATRRGLLLLDPRSQFGPKQMAVCDLFAGSCHLLPPLSVWPKPTTVSCTILKGAECGQHQQLSLNYFKVLAVVLLQQGQTQECKLYTFSSTDSRWSAPIKCFDEEICYRLRKRGFRFPESRHCNAVVCGGTVHWLIWSFDHRDHRQYYTLDVSADTAHTSLVKLPVTTTYSDSEPTLGVTADGSSLMLFFVRKEAHLRRLHMWTRIECEVWLHARVIELNIPREPNNSLGVHILPVEKSNTLFIIAEHEDVHRLGRLGLPMNIEWPTQHLKIDVETGTVEEQQFQPALSRLAVPMNIEWPTWLASRLS